LIRLQTLRGKAAQDARHSSVRADRGGHSSEAKVKYCFDVYRHGRDCGVFGAFLREVRFTAKRGYLASIIDLHWRGILVLFCRLMFGFGSTPPGYERHRVFYGGPDYRTFHWASEIGLTRGWRLL